MQNLQLNGDERELMDALESQIAKIEAQLASVMTERKPGFALRIVELLDQAKDAGAKLVLAQADDEKVKELDRRGQEYAEARQQEDRLALLVNRVLALAQAAMAAEIELRDRANAISREMNTAVREYRHDPELYKQLSQRRDAIQKAVDEQRQAPKVRAKIFGEPQVPSRLEAIVFGMRQFNFKSAFPKRRQRRDTAPDSTSSEDGIVEAVDESLE